jgi:HK97 family phage major capsid protein
MSFIAKQLRESRFKIVSDAQALISRDDAGGEAIERFDAMMVEADALKAKIDRVEKADAATAEMSEIIAETAGRGRTSVFQEEDGLVREKRIITGLLRGGMNALNGADREIVAQRTFIPQNTAMSTGTNSAGGYSIAPLFFPELQIAMKAQGGMRQAARVISTDTGASLPFPTLDDRSNVATIVSENTQITEDTELTFGQVSIGGYTYKSGVCLVSLQLINDSAFNFDEVVTQAIAGRMVRGQNAHFTTGSGSSQPFGIVTKAASGKVGTTGQTTSVIYNDLIDTLHAVDPVYRPGASWMLNDSSLKVIRKIVDGQSRPLWQAGLVDGAPDTLLGYPIVINQDVASMAANAKSILFGNMKSYIIRDVTTSLQLMVLRERYADFLQVGFISWMRSDGNLVSAASPVAYYQNSAT